MGKTYSLQDLRRAWGAGKHAAEKEMKPVSKDPIVKSVKDDPLRGKWFHSFTEDGRTCWQGQVLDRTANGYVVQLYDWIMGEPSCQKYVDESKLENWDFYHTHIDMNDRYQNVLASRDRHLDRLAVTPTNAVDPSTPS